MNRVSKNKTLSLDDSQQHADNGFSEFWSAYPRRAAKGVALHAYQAAIGQASASVILAGARSYAAQVAAAGTEERFVKHPATWLNGACWLDENTAPAPASPKAIDRVRCSSDRSDDQWRDILRHWGRMGCRPEYWQWRNGGMPGLGGCLVPSHICLEEEFKGLPWGARP